MSGAANSFLARAQYNNESTPASVSSSVIADTSSIVLPFSVNPLYPIDYEQLVEAEMASDLDTPSNMILSQDVTSYVPKSAIMRLQPLLY